MINTVCIFYDHDGIIYDNSQGEQKSKKNNKIQCVSQEGQQHKSDAHRQRNRHCYKQCICQSHKKHEDKRHQDKTYDDRIDKVMQGDTSGTALISGNSNLKILWEFIGCKVIDNELDLIRRFNEILTRAFDYIQWNDIARIEPAEAFLIFMSHFNFSDIFQI